MGREFEEEQIEEAGKGVLAVRGKNIKDKRRGSGKREPRIKGVAAEPRGSCYLVIKQQGRHMCGLHRRGRPQEEKLPFKRNILSISKTLLLMLVHSKVMSQIKRAQNTLSIPLAVFFFFFNYFLSEVALQRLILQKSC